MELAIAGLIVFGLGFLMGRMERRRRKSKLVRQLWRDLEAAQIEQIEQARKRREYLAVRED